MTLELAKKNTSNRKKIVGFLKNIREEIIQSFTSIETRGQFERSAWDFSEKGGGEISLLRGDVFEKAAVNWSGVEGKAFPPDKTEGAFFATGISIITHMKNPHAPTFHANIRYIKTEKREFLGGGYDLTPMGFPYEEDRDHFHALAKKTLDPFGKELYPTFSENAKNYFYIPHRNKERGMGGIFFDYLDLKQIDLWEAVGKSIPTAIVPIYKKRISTPFSKEDKEKQNQLRAHYVEFNLLYDRGTRFGFLSKGNPDAILCSMPPSASW